MCVPAWPAKQNACIINVANPGYACAAEASADAWSAALAEAKGWKAKAEAAASAQAAAFAKGDKAKAEAAAASKAAAYAKGKDATAKAAAASEAVAVAQGKDATAKAAAFSEASAYSGRKLLGDGECLQLGLTSPAVWQIMQGFAHETSC